MSTQTGSATSEALTSTGGAGAGSTASATGSAAAANGGSASGTPGSANLNVVTSDSKTNSGSSEWTTGLSDDLKGYAANKGWKSPADLIESYRGAEKLLGVPKDRVLKLPERFYDDAGKLTAEGRAIRETLGAPKEAKDYNLTAPKEGADPKMLEHFRSVFHELGIPKADAEKITGSWNDYIASQTNAAKETQSAAIRDQQASLQKEWGAAMEQNTTIAKEAVRMMGIDSQKIDAFAAIVGHAEAMKFFHKLGTQVGEAPFVGGQRRAEIQAPEQARNSIAEMKADKDFGRRLAAGDREALAKWQRAHEQAFTGEHRL